MEESNNSYKFGLLRCIAAGLVPLMTGDPVFEGPFEIIVSDPNCVGSNSQYTDFYFRCRVQYAPQANDDRARFNVSLTFDGVADPGSADTHVVTYSNALTVNFTSRAMKGHVGTKVKD